MFDNALVIFTNYGDGAQSHKEGIRDDGSIYDIKVLPRRDAAIELRWVHMRRREKLKAPRGLTIGAARCATGALVD